MISRRQHLEEMQYAVAHSCSLEEARRAIAGGKRRASEAAIRHLQERPIISGRQLERRRRESRQPSEENSGLPRWMMAD